MRQGSPNINHKAYLDLGCLFTSSNCFNCVGSSSEKDQQRLNMNKLIFVALRMFERF